MSDGIFTTKEVCELVGITYRELDYGVKRGYLPCSHKGGGSGRPHSFTLPDLLGVQAVVTRRTVAAELLAGVQA